MVYRFIIFSLLFFSIDIASFVEFNQSRKEKIVWFASAIIFSYSAYNFDKRRKEAEEKKLKESITSRSGLNL